MVSSGILSASEPLLFTVRNPKDEGRTILVALDADNNFYHSNTRGRPHAGAALHRTVRKVATEYWPGIKPSIREWIRIFNDYPISKFRGTCFRFLSL